MRMKEGIFPQVSIPRSASSRWGREIHFGPFPPFALNGKEGIFFLNVIQKTNSIIGTLREKVKAMFSRSILPCHRRHFNERGRNTLGKGLGFSVAGVEGKGFSPKREHYSKSLGVIEVGKNDSRREESDSNFFLLLR